MFLSNYLSLNEEERTKYGYLAETLIASCTFNGETCSHRNFTLFSSLQFGNCYTFNRKSIKFDPLQTPYVGPNSGLEISLNLDVAGYTELSPSIGARVIIHEPDVDPDPEDYGLNISPGYETSIAIEQTSVYRLPYPYRDKCRSYQQESNFTNNHESCIRKCIQRRNVEMCGCVDPFVPNDQDLPHCDLKNNTQVCCLEEVQNSLSEVGEPCDCPLPCKSTDFEMTISTAVWPSYRYFQKFIQKSIHPLVNIPHLLLKKYTKSKSSNETNMAESEPIHRAIFTFPEARRQLAKLKIFYKTLEKKYYKQEPMFQDSELFSQMGGQLGLWLGVSLVALFECVENLLHILHYCLTRKKKMK